MPPPGNGVGISSQPHPISGGVTAGRGAAGGAASVCVLGLPPPSGVCTAGSNPAANPELSPTAPGANRANLGEGRKLPWSRAASQSLRPLAATSSPPPQLGNQSSGECPNPPTEPPSRKSGEKTPGDRSSPKPGTRSGDSHNCSDSATSASTSTVASEAGAPKRSPPTLGAAPSDSARRMLGGGGGGGAGTGAAGVAGCCSVQEGTSHCGGSTGMAMLEEGAAGRR
mmetsp:Transcript_15148/g.48316  ORF Transcript_15148/g.48316 Transcript_15148/m.48316 type:complete len:226 (+) Transcript_15148:97-774(+)